MIDFTQPIYSRSNGTYVATINGYPYHVTENTPEAWVKLQAYLAKHPKAPIPEPVPPEPTQEELDRREEQSLLAYLANTDWYAVRLAETGKTITDDVASQRDKARQRISELRGE